MARPYPQIAHQPPTDEEERLGYYVDCVDCERRWAQRYALPQLHRCLPCARAWRRDYQNAKRHGLPRPSLRQAEPHPFKSKALGREVDLNDPAILAAAEQHAAFRAELDAYIVTLKERKGGPPLRGALSLRPVKRTQVVSVPADAPDEPPDAVVDVVEAHLGAVHKTRQPRRR